MILTLLAFVLTLSVLVSVHEYGHYRMAVACGVKVLRFSVGFGSVLWRHQATPESTEFVLCALPLGGYVKMLDEREGAVAPDERHRSFNRKSLWQRTAIVAAGPIANFLLAIALYAAGYWLGVDEPKAVMGTPAPASVAERAGLRAGDWALEYSTDGGTQWQALRSMSDLRWQVIQAVTRGEPLQLMVADRTGRAPRPVTLALDTLGGAREVDAKLMQRIGLGGPFNEPVLGPVSKGQAADQAGLRQGDRVLSVDGVPVTDTTSLHHVIRASGAGGVAHDMQWQIDRVGQSLTLTVTPKLAQEGAQNVGKVGVQLGGPPEMVTVQYGAWEGLVQAASQTWEMSAMTVRMLGKMVVGEASIKNLSGPLTIADYAGQSVRLGAAYYLSFLAVVSVSLGVLNLLPLPVLDGGHLMYYLFEGLTGRPVSEAWLDRLQRGGVAIMLMMMALAFYNDLTRLVFH
jgi:regulator of sigma E protease